MAIFISILLVQTLFATEHEWELFITGNVFVYKTSASCMLAL